MKLKRVCDLPSITESNRIYNRIRIGTMKYYEDEEGYACYDEDELKNYKPRKNGRKSKMSKLTNQNK